MVHAGALGVALGEVGHAKAHVPGVHRHRGRVHPLACLLSQVLPMAQVLAEHRPALEGVATVQPGGDPAGHLRCLDGDRPRAAAGIEQGPVLDPPLPPGGCQHRRGQRLLQRCLALDVDRAATRVAPTALEQCLARGVGIQRGLVGAEVEHQWQVRVARVDVRALSAGLAQRVAHGVLDAQRGEVQAAQRAGVGVHVHPQRHGRGDPRRPVHLSPGEVVQVVLVTVGTRRQGPQHSLGEAAFQVQPHRGARRAARPDSTTAGLGRLAGQLPHFLGQPGLGAASRGQEELDRRAVRSAGDA